MSADPRSVAPSASVPPPESTAPPKIAPPPEAVRRLPRHRRSAGRARTALRDQLREWHVEGDAARTAELVLSELVANAVKARTTTGREIGVRIELTGTALRLEVSDTSDDQPVPTHAAHDDECGRGLELIAALADGWGVRRRTVGKTVWAVLRLPQTVSPAAVRSPSATHRPRHPDRRCT